MCMGVNASAHNTQKKSLSKVFLFSFAVAAVVGRIGLVDPHRILLFANFDSLLSPILAKCGNMCEFE